jgi:mono/diheme cytochrome c family protein
MRAKGLLLAALALIILGTIGLVVMGSGVFTSTPHPGNTPAAKGEWIFRTGTDLQGGAIPYSGGMMMRQSCADCHGIDGQGLVTPMFVSPNITYRNLTNPEGMLEPDGGRGHIYTDALIKRAITEGIDAEGKPLSWIMPRWDLTEQELDDLLAYLRTQR